MSSPSVPSPRGAGSRPLAAGRRIGLLVERRYLSQPQPAGLLSALRSRGHEVDVLVIDRKTGIADHRRPWSGYDVVVARGRSPRLLDLLTDAERSGVPTMNRADSVRRVVDKARMGAALATAGVPIPWTYSGSVRALASQADGHFPLICKPVTGDNGRGIRVVRSPAELASLDWPEPAALAQELLPGDGYDLKLYGIGGSVWAVRRRSPLLGPDPGGAVAEPAGPALRELAVRCARLFGLDLYGVDCVAGPSGPVVIEVNDFPNYVGVPDADVLLAAQVLRVAARAHRAARPHGIERTAPCASR